MTPVGNGAGHGPPVTPAALVSVIVDAVACPVMVAVPVHTVPPAAVPENLNSPSNVDPVTAPLTSPDHVTVVDCQVPVTFAPD